MSYENLIDKYKDLEMAINDFNSNEVDTENAESVKSALDKLKNIHADLNEMTDEMPFAKAVFDVFLGGSISDVLDDYEKMYEEQYKKLLEKKQCSCTCKNEVDKSYCECNKKCSCNVDENLYKTKISKHDFIRDVTAADVEDVLMNTLLATVNCNEAIQSQLAEIIADYYNNSKTCPEVFEDEKEFRYITNVLFSFADYVLNK